MLLVVFLLGLVIGLSILAATLMRIHNKAQWEQRGGLRGRAGRGSCCRQDAPCSARCAELGVAQTVAGAVEGARHGDGLRDLIQLLEYLPQGSLREMIDAEAAQPGTLTRLTGALRGGPADALEPSWAPASTRPSAT